MKPVKPVVLSIVALVFVLFIGVKDGLAWGYTWVGINLEKVVTATRWKSGLLRYAAAFELNNAGYDTDLYFGSTGTTVPDYTFRAGPNVRLFVPLQRKLVFDLSENPQYAYYLRTKKERGFENTFKGQVHFILNRFYLRVGETLSDTRERLSTELNIKIRVRQDNPAGVILWQISPGSSVALQYRQIKYVYENLVVGTTNIRQNLDRMEHSTWHRPGPSSSSSTASTGRTSLPSRSPSSGTPRAIPAMEASISSPRFPWAARPRMSSGSAAA